MEKMKRYRWFSVIMLLALLVSAFAPAGAAQAQSDMPKSIVEIASGDARFKTLVAAVQAAGLVDTLNGAGPFTVFAPTDAAFAKLPRGTVEALLADPEALSKILLYHVAPSKLMAADVLSRSSANTAAELPVVFSLRNNSAYINDARITATDIEASNGVIHVIDTVILPPDKDIVDTAAGNTSFKTLVAAVQAAGLVDTLKGKGPFTIFAPTDAAFAKLPRGTVEALLADPEALKSILLYHAANGRSYSGDIAKLSSVLTINGARASMTTAPGGALQLNNARIVTPNILTTNGVIHVIDTVILPPDKDIVETAATNPQFKTLVAAVEAAGLAETLKGKGPFTIFAPTDAAFAKLPRGTVEALLADPEALKSILLYHATGRNLFSGDVLKNASAKTVNGADIVFTTRGGQALVNNARITTANILTTNGVIHVIDTVILPPDKDIVDTAAANPQFKTLVAAVEAAGLAETLKGKGPFTIFAPTDAAFAKLPRGTVEALLADPEALKSILLYHAVSGSVYSGAVTNNSQAETVNGADVTFTSRNGQLFINEARIVTPNIQTTNGVIHVIDTVILPPAE
jgi:transforming growth factor-beta-induced protein